PCRKRPLRLPGRVPRPLLREAPLPLRPARARRAAHVLRARPRRWPARARARAEVRGHRAGAGMSVSEVLDRALSGERISDAEAIELLRSRDLVQVGRAA